MKVKCLSFVLIVIAIFTVSGCGNNTSATASTQKSTEVTEHSTEATTEATTEQTSSSSNIIIYIESISASLRATWKYSLTEDGELLRDTYAFDNTCKYYNANEEAIDFEAFESIVSKNLSENNKLTKCLLTTNGKKLVSEVHVVN